MEVRTWKLKHLFFPVSSYSLTNLFYFYLFHFHPTLIDPLCLFIVFFNAFLCLMLSVLTARYKTSPHWLLSSGKKFSCSVFLVWRYFPQTMSKLPACTLSLSVYACWIWKWKLCYLESRKSVSCSLRGKLLLLLGLLIPDGAAVFDTHSNNILLLFSDTRLSFICASCLSFVSHPPAVAGQIPPPTRFHFAFTVAAPRRDVGAKRNHIHDRKTSVVWHAKSQSTRSNTCLHESDGKKWWYCLFTWASVFICVITPSKFPKRLTSGSRRTIDAVSSFSFGHYFRLGLKPTLVCGMWRLVIPHICFLHKRPHLYMVKVFRGCLVTLFRYGLRSSNRVHVDIWHQRWSLLTRSSIETCCAPSLVKTQVLVLFM